MGCASSVCCSSCCKNSSKARENEEIGRAHIEVQSDYGTHSNLQPIILSDASQDTDETELLNSGDTNESLKILDMQKYFKNSFDWNSLKGLDDNEKIFQLIENGAKNLEGEVLSFSDKHSSIEYFVLDEKLMMFIEHLDEIKCHNNPELLRRKVEVLEYIQRLQRILDESGST